MSSLLNIIRDAVLTADTTTKSLQATVTHRAWTGQTTMGQPTYANVSHKALVEQKLQLHKKLDGTIVRVKAKLTILEAVLPNGAAGRIEPVDPKDKFVLPDGSVGVVVDVEGMLDPGTSRPLLLEIYLGETQ